MKAFVEFEGKNVDNAVEKACEELNVTKEALQYDVISYGSSGIFGLVGSKKARIRVVVSEPKRQKTFEVEAGEQKVEEGQENNAEGVKSLVDDAFKEDQSGATTLTEDPLVFGKTALQKIIDLITVDATISVGQKDDWILFNIEGGNAAVLIGKHGQTLEAIQYLVDKIVNKRSTKRIRILVDVEGYMEKKRSALKRLASRLAEKAKRTGKPATVGQMNAYDRRLMHLVLKDDKGVKTRSMGEGYYRKLVIIPNKKNSAKEKGSN